MRKILFIFCICLHFQLYGQEEIDTDRPDQTENAHVLKPGEIQLETGVLLNHFEQGRNAIIGSGMLRYGMFEKIELRLLVEDGRESERYFTETALGRYPLAIGSKIELLEGHHLLPDIALVGLLNLPFLSSTDQNKLWVPYLLFAFEKKLSKLTVDADAGVQWDAFEHGHNYQGTGSFNYELTKKAKVFAEYFGQYESGKEPAHNLDAGLMYLLNKDLQLDIAAGSPVFAANHQPFATVGFSLRIPAKGK